MASPWLLPVVLVVAVVSGCAAPHEEGAAGTEPESDTDASKERDASSERGQISARDASRVDSTSGRGAAPMRTDIGVRADATDAEASEHEDAGAAPSASLTDAGQTGAHAQQDAGAFPPLSANVVLHVAGDSTSAIFPTSDPAHRVGWAAVLQSFFSTGVEVDDAAQSGRSSKSFADEGLWKALKAKIRPGDYVFVEFGHNDEKSDDPLRYTDPATTFRTNLKMYVSETRALGGVAVLLTPISRRKFAGSKIASTHGAYPAAVMAVAMETATPLIDMTERTRVLLESLGPTATVPLFATGDDTHLSAQGAKEVASLAVQGMRDLGLPLATRLLP